MKHEVSKVLDKRNLSMLKNAPLSARELIGNMVHPISHEAPSVLDKSHRRRHVVVKTLCRHSLELLPDVRPICVLDQLHRKHRVDRRVIQKCEKFSQIGREDSSEIEIQSLAGDMPSVAGVLSDPAPGLRQLFRRCHRSRPARRIEPTKTDTTIPKHLVISAVMEVYLSKSDPVVRSGPTRPA